MVTKTNTLSGIRIAVTLIGVIGASVAGAQQKPDAGNLPQPRVQSASCAEVAWNRDLLAQYPRIAEGCHEVVIADGGKWARFEADLVRSNRDGSVTLEFKDRQGRSMEELTLMPAPEQRVSIDGRNYRFSELVRNQKLNLYVPEGIFGIAGTPGAPTEQLAQIVREPVQVAQADRAPAPAGQLAQVDRAPAQTLPSTAGPLPLLVLAGLMSLLGGLGMTIRRRFFAGSGN